MTRYHPLKELSLMRLRELLRSPETVFWTYGFPVLLTILLGIAFRNQPKEILPVDILPHPRTAEMCSLLEKADLFQVTVSGEEEAHRRLRLGKTTIILVPGDPVTYLYDPMRKESAYGRLLLDDVLQRKMGRRDVLPTKDFHITEPGARYIDFLIPGLLGMNLLSGGLWGVGFRIVDMRVRKLLKRLIATPMPRSYFLYSIMGVRMLFTFPELGLLLGVGTWLFNLSIRGSFADILVVMFIGASSFAGMGLLVACRAQKIETVSGMINLMLLPQWLFSGVFFASERFPAYLQPLIQALPLTQMNNAMRAIILEGASLPSQWFPILVLVIWGIGSYTLALRWFRWS